MEPIITNEFPKQPREIKWLAVSFAEILAAYSDAARAVDPIELAPAPSGIVIDDHEFDPVSGLLQILVSGGTDGIKYVLTMWMHTESGQKLEHEITVKVKES